MPKKRQEKDRAPAEDEQRDRDKERSGPRVSGPRPFWSGTITFGLVSLPVGLYPANRSKPVSLRMIDRDGTPLARRYFCEKEERTLSGDELVRGYEVEKNEFIVIEDRELEELAPEKSQEIDLKRFVALSEIDPMYFERAYFLTPDKGITKAYRLLASSMEASERAGIATFVMRGKEYLVAIIAEKGILRAETLRFTEEVRTPDDIGLPDSEAPKSDRVGRFEKAIEALSTDTLDREALEDRHSRQLLERVRQKLEKGEGVIGAAEMPEDEGEAEQAGEVVDLMQVLKQSLEQGESPAGKPARGKSSDRSRSGEEAAGSANARRRTAASEGKKAATSKKKTTESKPSAKRRPKSSDLAQLSKSELYQRAQELDIPGRSGMSKEQLIRAIEDAA